MVKPLITRPLQMMLLLLLLIPVTLAAQTPVASVPQRNPQAIDGMPISGQTYFKAPNSDADDVFGSSIAIDGDTLVIGAPQEASASDDQANNDAENAGAVYVFVRSNNQWVFQAYLKASNIDKNDYFGYALALSGDTLVVGAPGEASKASGINDDQTSNDFPYAGAAYVFVRSGTTWTQEAYLKASNTNIGDYFGLSVDIDANTIVVGAFQEDSSDTMVNGDDSLNDMLDSGAAYVFMRSGTTWTQQAYLKASNTDSLDGFGYSVSVSGNVVAVGAPSESSNATFINGNQLDNSASNSGAVYTFVGLGQNWGQEAYIKASNTDSSDRFGLAVDIDGNSLVVGAPYESSSATGVGGDQTNNAASNSGAAYAYFRNSGVWLHQAYLKATNTEAEDTFGTAVSIDGDLIAVGASNEDSEAIGLDGDQSNNAALFSGAVYVFQRDIVSWQPYRYIKAVNTDQGDVFGSKVAMDGYTVLVSARLEDSSSTNINEGLFDNAAENAGAVYLIDARFKNFLPFVRK